MLMDWRYAYCKRHNLLNKLNDTYTCSYFKLNFSLHEIPPTYVAGFVKVLNVIVGRVTRHVKA
jgi:hypothetical protein